LTSCNQISRKQLDKDKVYSSEKAEKETEVVEKDALGKTESIDESASVILSNAEETLKKESLSENGVNLQSVIVTESKSIKDKVPELNRSVEQLAGILRAELEQMKKHNTAIINEAARQSKEFNRLMEESAEEKESLLVKNKELEEKLEQLHKSFLYKIMWFSILLVIAGIPLALYVNPKLGIGLSIGGLVTSALCIFLIKYLGAIAIGVGIVAILGVIGAIIYFVKKDKAIKELVNSFELVKNKDKWTEDEKKTVGLIQSKETKLLVDEVKKKNE